MRRTCFMRASFPVRSVNLSITDIVRGRANAALTRG
jgi:hypothetical protein